MIKFSAPAASLCLAIGLMAASPAIAQRGAPISQGVTSSDLAGQVQQARQQNAELRIQVGALTDDVAQLTGKVETIEFQFNRATGQIEQLETDNADLARELTSLRDDLAAQSALIRSLQARYGAGAGGNSANIGSSNGAATSTYPGATRSYTRTTTPQTQDQTTGASAPRETTTRSVTRTGPTRITPSPQANQQAVVNGATGAADRSAAITETTPEPTNSALQSGSLGTLPASNLPGGAGPLFADAKRKLISFDYDGAATAFQAFIEEFGDDPQAGEAYYWLGEALYQQGAYAESGAALTTMIRSFREDPRAPDALVKLARTMRLVGDTEKACLALDTLPKRYPNVSGVTNDLAAVERTRSGCDS